MCALVSLARSRGSAQEKFLKAELPNFAETCLSASCTDPEVQAGINTFLEKCHEVCFDFLICREVVVDPLFSLPVRVVVGVCFFRGCVCVAVAPHFRTSSMPSHLQFVVSFLKTDDPLPKTVQQLMLRLFLDDAACNFFFMNYGGCKAGSARALEVCCQAEQLQ